MVSIDNLQDLLFDTRAIQSDLVINYISPGKMVNSALLNKLEMNVSDVSLKIEKLINNLIARELVNKKIIEEKK